MKPQLSIVIEAYNEEHNALAPHLDTLAALFQQDFAFERVELVLIGSARQIAEWERLNRTWPRLAGVKFVAVDASEAHYWQLKNQAGRVAAGEFILFIDSDALPGPRWLPAAVERLENGADAVVGPSMYRNGRWKPGSALMLAAALPSWGFVLARTSMPGKPSPASLLSHNLAIRRELFLRHPFNTTKRSFCSSLLFFELARSGARIVFEPDQRVAHAMTFRWWSLTRHFRAGWETYQGRELDRDWPRMPSLERLKLLEPAVLRMGVACHDLRHWFRYSRVLGIHPARRIVLFPLVAAASFTARTCEMAGMYAALFAPKATERQARF